MKDKLITEGKALKGTRITDKKIIDLIEQCKTDINNIMPNAIDDNISYESVNSSRTAGQLSIPHSPDDNFILKLNSKLLECSENEIKNTVYHELCHYIVDSEMIDKDYIYFDWDNYRWYKKRNMPSGYQPHGSKWQHYAKLVGNKLHTNITTYWSPENKQEFSQKVANDREQYRYEVVCKNCGWSEKNRRKTEFVKNPNITQAEYYRTCKDAWYYEKTLTPEKWGKYENTYRYYCPRCKKSGQFEVKSYN